MMSTTTGTSVLGVEEDILGQKWIGYKSFLKSEENLHAQIMVLTITTEALKKTPSELLNK